MRSFGERKWGILSILGALTFLPLLGWGAGENRAPQWEPTAVFGWETDQRHVVRFTTTTTAGNQQVCLVSTHTAFSLTVPSDVGFSPTQTSSTTYTWGGRAYMAFQVVSATSNVSLDFGTVNLSTATSPYLTQGQWFSPDDPVAWQGPVCLVSPSTFTVTGWYWMPRAR